MNTIKIAICDDEPNIRRYLASLIRRQDIACEIAEYTDAASCLSDRGGYDLLFLDIELGGQSACAEGTHMGDIGSGPVPPEASHASMDGMALARQLRDLDLDRQPLIIFVTGHERYVYEAFDVDAFQYLTKPIDEERFAAIFRRAMARLSAEAARQRRTLVLQSAGAKKMIPLDSIYYVESRGHKILLHLKQGTGEYYARIGELEKELQGHFARIHKGYLVNLMFVEEYTRGEVTLTNGDRLMISKYKYDAFVKMHLRFLQQ